MNNNDSIATYPNMPSVYTISDRTHALLVLDELTRTIRNCSGNFVSMEIAVKIECSEEEVNERMTADTAIAKHKPITHVDTESVINKLQTRFRIDIIDKTNLSS